MTRTTRFLFAIGLTLGLSACGGTPDGPVATTETTGLTTPAEAVIGGSQPIPDEQIRASIEESLQWLVRHQAPDGHWSSHDFLSSCGDEQGPCRHLEPASAPDPRGVGFAGYDVGVTSLAMLAFLGHAHTHRDGEIAEFRQAVRSAMMWLLAQQVEGDDPTTSGLFGAPLTGNEEWVYNHALATRAICELLVLSRDRPRLAGPAEAAVRWCLRAQNPGYGWKYGYRTGKNDTSVTGWMVLALQAAQGASLQRVLQIPHEEFEPAFEGAQRWFRSVTSSESGVTGYESPGDEGARLVALGLDDYPYSKQLPSMTAVALLGHFFSGASRGDTQVEKAAELLGDELPEWRPRQGRLRSKVNQLYWYFGTTALFIYGGDRWKVWDNSVTRALIEHQRSGGCADGSWDPIGEWGIVGGRVYSTAIGALTLHLHSRYERSKGR